MTPQELIQPHGRSGLLRANAKPPVRARRYWLRWLVLAIILTAVAALLWAVSTNYFNPNGPLRVLYQIHDGIYLPLHAAIWTRRFPYVFLWLLPLIAFVLVFGIEFLSKFSLLRYTHRRIILIFAQSALGRSFITTSDRLLRIIGQRAEFARTIIALELEQRSEKFKTAIWQNSQGKALPRIKHDMRSFQSLVRLDHTLSSRQTTDLIRAVEYTKLARLVERQKTTTPKWLMQALGVDDTDLLRDVKLPLAEVLNVPGHVQSSKAALLLVRRIETKGATSAELAAKFLACAAGVLMHECDEFQVLLKNWNRRGLISTNLSAAEQLFDMEFWAALGDQLTTQHTDFTALATHAPKLQSTDLVGSRFAFDGESA